MTGEPATDCARRPFSDEAVIAVVAGEIGVAPEEIQRDKTFGKDLGLDSLDFIKLVMAVEQALETRIDDKEAAKVRTVEDLLGLARRACTSAGAP
ncbi:MAG TPA: phosphopantetheine-binding protein [Candidatus Bathyarchaeia archaeon]|nr:phosphopantetheine-binding protein [Candidatus Bathyarchaeia archaeon]